MKIIRADELFRHSSVIRDPGEMPYLVDSVTDLESGLVRVVYSSGDVDEYEPHSEVKVVSDYGHDLRMI